MADEERGVSLTGAAVFDQDLYGAADKHAGYAAELPLDDEEPEDDQQDARQVLDQSCNHVHSTI